MASSVSRWILFILSCLVFSAWGLPNGAPVCTEGESAPGAPHRGPGFQELSIAQGNMTVTIDGQDIATFGPLTTGVSYRVTITRTDGDGFRGVLARVNGGDADIDTTTVMSLEDGEQDLQIAEPCTDVGAGGVTHTNNDGKTEVTFFMEFDEPSTNVLLDVNIVESNPDPSVFYYSPYTFNVLLPPPANDQCLSAASLVVNDASPTSGTTLGSTTSAYCFDSRGRFLQSLGVWYIFLGTGNIMTLSTCHPETDYDSRMIVMSSCRSSCFGSTAGIGGVDVASCDNPFGRQLTFETVADRLYYVFVYGATASTVGNFQISVVDYTSPPNDECLDSLSLTVNGPTLVGNTVNATLRSYCFRSGTDPSARGLWYVATGTGNVMTFSTCHAETTIDSRLAVQNGGCGTGCVTTTDAGVQGLADCDNPFGRQVTFDSVVDRLYYTFVFGSRGGQIGVSVVDYQAPSNDLCVDATPLTVNGPVVTASNVNATLQNYCFRSGTDPLGRGVWYVVIGTGNVMTVSTCHPSTDFDTRFGVQSGSCSAGCVNDEVSLEIAPCGNPFGRQVTFDSVNGQAYYIHVIGTTTSNTGTFGLNVVDYPRPSNDACLSPAPLLVGGGVVSGTTIGATKEHFCFRSGSDPIGRGVWYLAIGNGNVYTVSTCDAQTTFQTEVRVQDGSCSAGCLPDRSSGLCANGNPFGQTVSFESVPGRPYYIYIRGSVPSSVGDFGISLVDNTTQISPPPTRAPSSGPPGPVPGARGGLVTIQASARRFGGEAGRRYLGFLSFVANEDAREMNEEDDERELQGRFRGSQVLRATVQYGGPNNFYGYVPLFGGTLLGMTVILENAITSGQIGFSFQVNGQVYAEEEIIFSSSDGGRSQILELESPISVEAGDVVEIRVRDSRFAGDFDSTQSLLPERNTAGITFMMQH